MEPASSGTPSWRARLAAGPAAAYRFADAGSTGSASGHRSQRVWRRREGKSRDWYSSHVEGERNGCRDCARARCSDYGLAPEMIVALQQRWTRTPSASEEDELPTR